MFERVTRQLGVGWSIATGLVVIALIVFSAAGVEESLGAVAFLYILFYVVAVLATLALAAARRLFPGWFSRPYTTTPAGGLEGDLEHEDVGFVEPNMGAIWVAAAAAALAVISVFLPRVESDTFIRVQENTLIQSGDGWLIIGCAIGIAGAAYRAYRDRTNTWAVLVLGLVIVGFAVYAGSGERLELESAGSVFGEQVADTASPGIGIYAAGAAGAIAIFAGWSLAGKSGTAFETETAQRTKICPECAETVLSEARICKHCGYRFAPPVRES